MRKFTRIITLALALIMMLCMASCAADVQHLLQLLRPFLREVCLGTAAWVAVASLIIWEGLFLMLRQFRWSRLFPPMNLTVSFGYMLIIRMVIFLERL